MKHFKPGQQVVYKTDHIGGAITERDSICPKENEIVTIGQRNPCVDEAWHTLVEYPLSGNGLLQVFSEIVLFPLEEITAKQSESVLANIERTFEPIPELETI